MGRSWIGQYEEKEEYKEGLRNCRGAGKVLCFISADTARELECLGEYRGKKAEDIVGWAKTETRVWQKQTPG